MDEADHLGLEPARPPVLAGLLLASEWQKDGVRLPGEAPPSLLFYSRLLSEFIVARNSVSYVYVCETCSVILPFYQAFE